MGLDLEAEEEEEEEEAEEEEGEEGIAEEEEEVAGKHFKHRMNDFVSCSTKDALNIEP